MTHTYLKMFEKRYDVGQWLVNRDGYHQFQRLFSVPNINQAMNAVCMLNGGTRTAANALHIIEEEREEKPREIMG
jgi:hypothetical protein